eukprot:4408190-Ditylum_brightwellii.AAC.1
MWDEEEALGCKLLILKFSDDIGISFGLDKCAVLMIRKGKVVPTQLTEDIPRLDNGKGYQYLGILESSDFFIQKVKDSIVKEYYAQVRKNGNLHFCGTYGEIHIWGDEME